MEQIVATELKSDSWLSEVGLRSSGRSAVPEPGEAWVDVGHIITT